MKSESDFPTQPNYSQTTTQNSSWVNVTLTRIDGDGSRSQVLIIAAKK